MNGPNSDIFVITTLNITLFNFWVRLALGKIVYCENTTTNTSSHILIVNTLWIFLVNLYKKWNWNYTERIGWRCIILPK